MTWSANLAREVKREFQCAQRMARGHLDRASQTRELDEAPPPTDVVVRSGRRRIVVLAGIKQ